MAEPIRIMGYSALQYIEAMCDQNILHYDAINYWPDFLYYAQNNFKDFIEDVLDDYLDRYLPEIFGVARYRVRFEIQAHVPPIDWNSRNWSWIGDQDNPAIYNHVSAMRISVRSDHFRHFIIEYPVPELENIYNPSSMKNWICRIGEFMLDHIRNDSLGRGYMAHPSISVSDWERYIREGTPEQASERERQKELSLAASQKAQELLFEHLDNKQRVDYLRTQSFIVRGQSGTRYRIRKASQINVDVLDRKNKVKYKLCTVPDMNNSGLPIEDQLLAQKTLIELDEQQFLSIAREW